MPSPFDALDADISRAVMAAFGETGGALLRPRARTDYTEGADPSRPEWPLCGIFSEGHTTDALRGAAQGGEHTGVSRLSLHRAEFFAPAEALKDLPYAIRPGDQLILPDRPGQPIYTISDMQASDTGDLNLMLV